MIETDWKLLAKYVQGESTSEETQRLLAWADEDAAHRELLERAQRAWQASGDVYQAYTPDATQAWDRIDQRIKEAPVVPRRLRTSRRVWLLRVAAALLIAVGAVYLVQMFAPPGGLGLAEVRTEAHETQQLRLADGTRVWLNENTTLRYSESFDDSVRRVYLRGEAFFDVARNEQQPFLIASQGALTRVLGTSFNVAAPDQDTAVVVTVVSGVVALSGPDRESRVLLRKNERGVYRPASQRVDKTDDVPPNTLAWRTRRMVFANQPLSAVSKVLEEAYQTSVVVDPALAGLQLTAQFDDQPLDEVLDVIALTLDISHRTEGDTVYLEEIKK